MITLKNSLSGNFPYAATDRLQQKQAALTAAENLKFPSPLRREADQKWRIA